MLGSEVSEKVYLFGISLLANVSCPYGLCGKRNALAWAVHF